MNARDTRGLKTLEFLYSYWKSGDRYTRFNDPIIFKERKLQKMDSKSYLYASPCFAPKGVVILIMDFPRAEAGLGNRDVKRNESPKRVLLKMPR